VPELGGCFADHMHSCAVRYTLELDDKADEEDDRAISLEPIGSTARKPALLTGGLVSDGDVGSE
jgi:hypothetical protein